MAWLLRFLVLLIVYWAPSIQADDAPASIYNLGVGKSDITGPVADTVLMGFCDWKESATGLLNRLYARAFIVEDLETDQRVVVVTADIAMLFQLVRDDVLQQLEAKFGDRYNSQNVVLHAIHSHAGPGGSSGYWFYSMLGKGYVPETFEAITSGIVDAISQAHESLAPGKLFFSKTQLTNASKNRSPDAYKLNPAEERAKYEHDFDVDLRMLHFRDLDDGLRGALAFFPVHATSLTGANTLVSGDNKGYAEWFAEQLHPSAVIGLGMSNGADISPNRIDNGDGTFRGEGKDPIESAEIIGYRQADKMLRMLLEDAPVTPVSGNVLGRLAFVDFSNVTINGREPTEEDPFWHRTCPSVLGQNMAAGTEDGRGWEGVVEGSYEPHPLYTMLGEKLKKTPEWLRQCHHAEKIPFLATGLMEPPPWVPSILPVQVLKIGQIGFAVTNFETTTMAGRRIKSAVLDGMKSAGVEDVELVSCSNAYSQYMTTREEYFKQDYEGASTLFGPNEQSAVQQELVRVARSVADPSIPLDVGPAPPKLNISDLPLLQPGNKLDTTPDDKSFGDLRQQPKESYVIGETASASFYGAHPKNNLQKIVSFCDVERRAGIITWSTELRDAHWDVRFRWERVEDTESNSTCEWYIRPGAPTSIPTTYRFHHFGYYKDEDGDIIEYEGRSDPFQVVMPPVDEVEVTALGETHTA